MSTTTEPATLRPIGWTGPTGAKVTRHLRFLAATDNLKGRRQGIVSGDMEVVTWPSSDDGFTGVELRILGGLDLFTDAVNHVRFLVDDATSLTLYYVATFHPTERTIGLKTLRPGLWDPEDNGPKRLYHLKITGQS